MGANSHFWGNRMDFRHGCLSPSSPWCSIPLYPHHITIRLVNIRTLLPKWSDLGSTKWACERQVQRSRIASCETIWWGSHWDWVGVGPLTQQHKGGAKQRTAEGSLIDYMVGTEMGLFKNGVSQFTPNPLVTVIIIFPRTSMTWSFWGMPHVRHISFCHHRCRKDPLTLTSTKSRTCAFSPSWRVVLKLVPGLDQHHQRWQVSICSLIKGVWSAVAVIFQTYYRTPGDVQFVQNETRDDFAKRSGNISSLMVEQSNITSTGFDWNRAPWFQWSIIISFLENDHILVIKLNVFESFSDKAVCHRRTHTHIQGSSQNWLPGKTIEGKPKEFHAKNPRSQ